MIPLVFTEYLPLALDPGLGTRGNQSQGLAPAPNGLIREVTFGHSSFESLVSED